MSVAPCRFAFFFFRLYPALWECWRRFVKVQRMRLRGSQREREREASNSLNAMGLFSYSTWNFFPWWFHMVHADRAARALVRLGAKEKRKCSRCQQPRLKFNNFSWRHLSALSFVVLKAGGVDKPFCMGGRKKTTQHIASGVIGKAGRGPTEQQLQWIYAVGSINCRYENLTFVH